MTKIRSNFFLQEQMTYQNAQFRNFGNDEGDILNFFNDHLRNLVAKNGGDNSFSSFSEEFHDKDIPIEKLSERTRISLTHNNHTITQIEKSFINMIVEFDIGFNDYFPKENYFDIVKVGEDEEEEEDIFEEIENDAAHINQIFIGFKDAVEIISEAKFYVDGKLIQNYHQTEMIRESFAYNSIRSRESKINSPHSHSLWENVINMSPNVCGVYIPISSLCWEDDQTQKLVHIELELIIPFTDQLVLQAWRLYPNRLLGEIEEEVRFSLDGLVWCQIPPENVAKRMRKRVDQYLFEYNCPIIPLENRFHQIGQRGRIVSSFKPIKQSDKFTPESEFVCLTSMTFDPKSVVKDKTTSFTPQTSGISAKVTLNTLSVNTKNFKIREGRSNLFGFGLKPACYESLMSTFQEPIIIPAQEMTRVIFDQLVKANGINISKSMPLKNATNITMMFPITPYDFTVYRNIMCTHVRLIIDKKIYPNREFENTWDGRFVQYQLMANELDGIEATPEYLESISESLNDLDHPMKKPHYSSQRDDTNFGINFQLERGNSGYVFDGVDTNNHEVTVRFLADNAFQHELSVMNSYLYPLGIDDSNPIFPEMWICSDTYWTWSTQDGVQYHDEGVPNGYQ